MCPFEICHGLRHVLWALTLFCGAMIPNSVAASILGDGDLVSTIVS